MGLDVRAVNVKLGSFSIIFCILQVIKAPYAKIYTLLKNQADHFGSSDTQPSDEVGKYKSNIIMIVICVLLTSSNIHYFR